MEPSPSRNDQPLESAEPRPPQPNPPLQGAESVTGVPDQPTEESYVSNPFQVFIDSIKKLFTAGLSTFLKFAGVIILTVALVVSLILLANTFETGPLLNTGNPAVMITTLIAVVLLFIWAVVLQAAWEKFTIETARGKKIPFGSALRTGYKKAAGLLVVKLLTGALIFLGLILLIVPGLVFWYWFVFAPSVYIDKEIGVIEAMKESKRLVKGKLEELIGLAGTLIVFGLPLFVPILGAIYNIFFAPVKTITWKYRYTSADMLDKTGTSKPPTHVANRVMIWILIILFALMAVIFIMPHLLFLF